MLVRLFRNRLCHHVLLTYAIQRCLAFIELIFLRFCIYIHELVIIRIWLEICNLSFNILSCTRITLMKLNKVINSVSRKVFIYLIWPILLLQLCLKIDLLVQHNSIDFILFLRIWFIIHQLFQQNFFLTTREIAVFFFKSRCIKLV